MPIETTSARGLWRSRDFVKLWAAETISVAGSLITRTALPFTAILVLDAGPFQVALLAVADLLPGLLLGLLAGAWVDRLPRRPILIAADLGRAALLATIPAAALLGVLRVEQLYLVALLTGALTVFFEIAHRSYLPTLVRREQLIEGNSKLSASASVAEVGAFGLGGWLVQLLTAPTAILVDALSFLLSALLIGRISHREPPPAEGRQRQDLRREIVEGLRVVASTPLLRALAISGFLLDSSFRVTSTVYLLYTSRELGFDPGVLGMVFAVGGVSSFFGAMAAGRTVGRWGMGRTMVGSLVLLGLGQLFLPLAPGATPLGLALLVAHQLVSDGAATVYDIHQVSLRQATTNDRQLGRVNASLHVLGAAAMLLGALAGGSMAEWLGLRPTLLIGAAGVLLAALALVASPARQAARPAETPAPAGAPSDLSD